MPIRCSLCALFLGLFTSASSADEWTCDLPSDLSPLFGLALETEVDAHVPRPDQGRCIVFFTSSDAGRGITTIGRGDRIEDAVVDAARRPVAGGRPEPRWLRLDVVTAVGAAADQAGEPIMAGQGLGLIGRATSPGFEAALHPEELLGYYLIGEGDVLQASRIIDFLGRFPHRAPRVSMRDAAVEPGTLMIAAIDFPLSFRVRAFFRDVTAPGPPVELLRGTPRSSGRSSLERARRAGDYLVRSVGKQGRFAYNYLPKSDLLSNDYNILRHAGSVFSLFELARVTDDVAYREAGERALEYLRAQFRACPFAPDALCVVEGNEIKLGGSGLAVLALLEHPGLPEREELLEDARRLGAGILALQQEDGRFWPHKVRFPDGLLSTMVSIYYPGEAIFALARLTDRTGDPRWLRSANRAARYLIEDRDGDLSDEELPHDHWLSYGLREIARLAPAHAGIVEIPTRDRYVERMGLAIARAQHRQDRDPRHPDWIGGFYMPPRAAPTATRMEGLGAIVELMVAEGSAEADVLDEFGRTLCLGSVFLARTQFGPSNAMFLAEPMQVQGGIRRGLTAFQLRIDTSQHAISALLGLERLQRAGHVTC